MTGIAHDFNNILTVVQGNLELLSMEGSVGETRERLLSEATRAVETGPSLTTSLMSFSRKSPHATRIVDLREVITEMDPLLSRSLSRGLLREDF